MLLRMTRNSCPTPTPRTRNNRRVSANVPSASAQAPDAAGLRPELLLVCALAGFLGSVAPIVLNMIAAAVAEHDFVADTVSDLGRGPHKWIMDTGFYLHAAGLLGLAIGAAHLHLGKWDWSFGILSITGLALVAVLIGVWDKFGGAGDMSVHTKLTFALGPLYLLAPLLLARGAATRSRFYPVAFIMSALLWIVFAAAFKLAPDSIDGILEKTAILATILWTMPLSWLFLSKAIED